MDELRGPNIQIILYVKEGLGFGFLKTPFVVSGSLNGYMLETDPTVPGHAPVFDAELVWEADKRKFRSLRVQNVPVKVEVYATGTQGRKDKVGYLLLSLLGAQPCPANKVIDMKYTWHRLLGVKSAGKCCHPQLLMSLSVEDRVTMLTPRNELRMFHSNEIAYPSSYSAGDPPAGRSVLMTIEEYMMESKKTVTSLDLQPKLICDEGVIQIGDGCHLFVLSFVIGSVENLDLLLPERLNNESVDCYVAYSVFTHNVMTDRVCATSASGGGCAQAQAQFNQRTSLQLRAALRGLARYFAECPHLVVRICAADKDVGVCSMDLRKLVPTEDLQRFVDDFCNSDGSLTIHERCFILRCGDPGAGPAGPCAREAARRPYVDVEMSLRHVADKRDTARPTQLTARSAAQLTARSAAQLAGPGGGERTAGGEREAGMGAEGGLALGFRSGSCAHLDADVGGVAYTCTATADTGRYKTASGDSVLQINEIAELLRKMYDAFSMSQQRLQAGGGAGGGAGTAGGGGGGEGGGEGQAELQGGAGSAGAAGADREPVKLETSKSDTCIWHHEKDMVKQTIPALERDAIMQRFVDELEDWKEKQQELFKCQLKHKEDYHLELLSKEWAKKRFELESKLSKGIEQCRTLAADLSRATDDFRLRGYRNTEREKKLLEAKKALEAHYTAKYQELREASRKMEDDMSHQLKLKDMRVEELEMKVAHLEKQVDTLKNNMRNSEKDAESRYSGLTKDQTASLIQELRCLEEKLDGAAQAKAFFKEQWGRAVRELHLLKLASRRRALDQLRRDRSQLPRSPGDHGLDTIVDQEEQDAGVTEADMKRLRDDFYVDILANTPALDSLSMISTSRADITGMDMYDGLKTASKNPMNEKLNALIAARDRLIQDDNPDEEMIKQLNHDIRSMLLNCSS